MTRHPLRSCCLLACLLACCLAPALRAAPAPTGMYDRWYIVKMDGAKIGWLHESQVEGDNGHIVSAMQMKMSIGRMGQSVDIDMRTEFVETADGEPVSMLNVQDMGLYTIETRYAFKEDGVEVTSVQAGRETTKTQPRPEGDWLTPGEVHRFVAKRLEAGAEKIAYETLDPSTGLAPMGIRQRVLGETTIEVLGKTVPAIEWEVQQSIMPGTSREFVDLQGIPLRMNVPLGGMSMEIIAADKALATADFDAPEMMNTSFVRVEKNIDDERNTRRASYLLTHTGEDIKDLCKAGIFLDAGVQRVERVNNSTVRVRIDLDDNRPAKVSDELRADALGSSVYIDPTDEKIRELTNKAIGDLAGRLTPAGAAARIETFVREYVTNKALGVGFATSSEVCRTREGDCSEHAMLLAAMLRARDIPSQVVTGLVYADGFMGERQIFGYHMWAQALLTIDGEERWVDFDAAIGTMDATHIAISRSTMADDDPVTGMLDMISVFGALEIEVESVE